MMYVRARKAAVGGDTSVEDDVLEELTGSKNEMKQGYKEGNGSGQGSQGSSGKGNN